MEAGGDGPKCGFPLPQLSPSVAAAGWGGDPWGELCDCRALTTAWHSRFPGIKSREFYVVVISPCHQMGLKRLADKLAVGCCILRIYPHTAPSKLWPVCGKKENTFFTVSGVFLSVFLPMVPGDRWLNTAWWGCDGCRVVEDLWRWEKCATKCLQKATGGDRGGTGQAQPRRCRGFGM